MAPGMIDGSVDATAAIGEALDRCDRGAGAVGPGPHDHLGAPLGTDLRADVDDRSLLVGVERGRLPRRPEGHQAGRAGVEIAVGETLHSIERHRAVGGERRDERNVHTAE